MIGRFILHCDTEYFDLARDAAMYLMENPEHKSVVTSESSGGTITASVFAQRLKKSITVRQIKP